MHRAGSWTPEPAVTTLESATVRSAGDCHVTIVGTPTSLVVTLADDPELAKRTSRELFSVIPGLCWLATGYVVWARQAYDDNPHRSAM